MFGQYLILRYEVGERPLVENLHLGLEFPEVGYPLSGWTWSSSSRALLMTMEGIFQSSPPESSRV
jgi:hypothetical protein